MDWTLLIVAALVIGGFLTLKRLSFVPATLARQQLLAGALVIDVRSTGEFQHKHLPSVINIPLGQLHDGLPRRVPDKNQVLLLYCHSGGRSAIAQRQAKQLGYPNVFNLGSYGRAERIIQTATNPSPSAP